MSDVVDEPEDAAYGGRRFACDRGEHSSCTHLALPGAFRRLYGDRYELRSSMRGDDALCGCTCHVDCPITVDGDATDWPQRCTCNGAQSRVRAAEHLRTEGEPDLAGLLVKLPGEVYRRRQARRAVEKRAAGNSVEEVVEIIAEEWDRRGLPAMPDAARRRLADALLRPPGRVERLRLRAAVGGDLAGLPLRLKRSADKSFADLTTDLSPSNSYEIASGKGDPIEVVVDAGDAELGRIAAEGLALPSFLRNITLELRQPSRETVEVWGRPRGKAPIRLGTLPKDSTPVFAQHLAAAARVGQSCVVTASFARQADGSWHLFVPPPLTASSP